jgi:hypothetical protein
LVKYSLGLLVTLFTAILLLGVTMLLNWFNEGMSARFAGLLLIKTSLWAWFCWSALFAFAFLGRYRFATGFILIITLLFLENQLDIKVSRFGPFALIGEQFAYERFEIPIVSIAYTLGLIAVFTGIGFAFGLFRDANMASMLAEKMSFREKLATTAMIISVFFVIASVIERQKSTEPLYLPGAIDVAYARGTVSVAAAVAAPKDEELSAIQRHAKSTSELLNEVGDYLRIASLPKLYLVHRPDFKSDRFELGDLDTRQGVLIRMNATNNAPDDKRWQRMVVRSVLMAHQHNRLDSDTRDWVVTGFAAWWTSRNDHAGITQGNELDEGNSDQSVRDVSASDLRRWRAYKKEVGESRAEQAAGRLLITLSEKAAPDSLREFLVGVLGYQASYDFRATIHDYWYSVSSVLRSKTKLKLSDLITSSPENGTEGVR